MIIELILTCFIVEGGPRKCSLQTEEMKPKKKSQHKQEHDQNFAFHLDDIISRATLVQKKQTGRR